MRSRRRMQAIVLFSLAPLCALLAMACSPSVKGSHHQAAPLPLSNPTIVTAGPVSLAVGTNHWSNPASGLEEAFFPVAVIVRNTGNQPLCGGVSTAALGDSAGASVSAIFPEGVVTRLFGPFASVAPMPQPTVKAAAFADQDVFLVLVHGSHGGHASGISPGGGGFPGGAARPPHFAPSPRVFAPPLFSSPFSSPFSPFAPSPFWPFYPPLPPLYPYGYPPSDSGSGPSLPPNLQSREEERPEVDQALVKEILAAAFASRPLAPQEERSGFLFFPLPVPDVGATVLTWGWYDCVTHELVAHLAMPIPVEQKM